MSSKTYIKEKQHRDLQKFYKGIYMEEGKWASKKSVPERIQDICSRHETYCKIQKMIEAIPMIPNPK